VQTVIIGSGIGGVTLAQELVKLAPESNVCLLTQETHGYYSRPLLSHGFTREDIESKIIMRSFEALRESGIDIRAGVEVLEVDPAAGNVTYQDDSGQSIKAYDNLVFAMGSAALLPPPFVPQADLFYVFNSLSDLIQLRRLRGEIRAAGNTPNWAVVGGGLIGCEVASDLATAGDQVDLFHAMPKLMERQLVEEDSDALAVLLEADNISVQLDCAVGGFEKQGGKYGVLHQNGTASGYDGIIVSCGFKPRVDLAKAAGLATGRGILVDDNLTTNHERIYAVGDVAEFSDGKIYAYVTPIRNQAIWLAKYLTGANSEAWQPPFFKPKAKVHGFDAQHPYKF